MKDLFSGQAYGYAAFRPTYPKELYDFILPLVKNKNNAWDCATGNGQVARDLAPHFQKVMATDSSARQIDNALKVSNVEYTVCPAEKTSFPDSTFDLIAVGQAIHWFNFPEFYKEAVRVGKSGALLAVWGYSLLRISPTIDKLISDFYLNIVGPYWDAERGHVDNHYKSIPFPFKEISSPEFSLDFSWTIEELEGYLSTWSSVQKYIQINGENPVKKTVDKIMLIWPQGRCIVTFPLFVRCALVAK
jgi:ubiquinone/menaquinone biosynthesis C-methylase UbiE